MNKAELIALLDAHVKIAEQDKIDMVTWERRKGSDYWTGKLEWLTFALDKAKELKEGK